jgi:hypothetical protein
MDTMKLLLGATIALLFGALVLSWQNMKTGVNNAAPDEIARLKKQVAELLQEQEKQQLERQIEELKAAAANNSKTPDMDAMKAQLEAQQAALAELEVEKSHATRDAKVEQDEEGLLAQRNLEKGDTELRRARMIADALLIGRIQEYVNDPQFGGFATFEILMPEQVQPGTILAIRRKTGVLGQLKVSEVSPEGGIAPPVPGFAPFTPEAGDELILPPQY